MQFAPSYILALDAGFASCGIALWSISASRFVGSCCVVTEKNPKESLAQNNLRRSGEVALRLATIMEGRRIYRVVAEIPHGGAQSASAMSAMAIATATIASVCAVKKVPLVFITPNQVKRKVTPRGAVSKKQVQAYVAARFGSKHLPKRASIREHIADAMAAFSVYYDEGK